MSNLDGLSQYNDTTTDDLVTWNVMNFFKYGLLEVGAYYNIDIDQVDPEGDNLSILKPLINIYGLTDYTRYEGVKNDWIWEQGVTLKGSGTVPLSITGIDVDGTVYATGTNVLGTGYHIDYSRGHLVFDNPLTSGMVVKCPHSIRWVQTYRAEEATHRQLKTQWFDAPSGSGINDIQDKAFLPAVFIGTNGMETIRGLQLGARSKVANVTVEFDIYGNSYEVNKIADMCYNLETKAFELYDVDTAPFPLTISGTISDATLTWPNLVSNYPLGRVARFRENARVIKYSNTLVPIKRTKVIIGLELDIHPN